MRKVIKVAIIGMDTSHVIEFPKRFLGKECEAAQRVSGVEVVACQRFMTSYTSNKVLNNRQKMLEGWKIPVTTSFSKAVKGCNAVMLEINDPNLHLAYFNKVAGMGVPVFIDKPLAGTVRDGQRVIETAKRHGTRVMSCSALRFSRALQTASKKVPSPDYINMYGPIGGFPAKDPLIWYGVHSFEMLVRAKGIGATSVRAFADKSGRYVAIVHYPDGNQAIVECTKDYWHYGGRLMTEDKVTDFVHDATWGYFDLLKVVKAFFRGGKPPVTLDEAYEVLAIMCAARKSIGSGKRAKVERV